MKNHWHERIQRYVNGQSSAEEATALHEALNAEAELRALYLDYMNLDVALGAAAEAATITEIEVGQANSFPRPFALLSSHPWRWVAAAAACAVLVMLAMLPRHRDSSRLRPDFAVIISSAQSAIARLSYEPDTLLPTWMSPTASMLDQPRLPQ
ncbi:MAG: hypothetical protein HY735_05955 [Verrucomicrobia bacterium]|nr:hypothetical protein [Verrucomicrobiota bacterium]